MNKIRAVKPKNWPKHVYCRAESMRRQTNDDSSSNVDFGRRIPPYSVGMFKEAYLYLVQ